ncbi:MAG: NAD-dependent epimerase/dehydratase family protein, partial [Planctomycetota bacterium]
DDDVVYGPTTISRWSYGCSKAIDEWLALGHAQRDDLPVVIARFFNTVGPRQVGRYGMVVPRFVEAALTGEALTVHGDGQQQRCFADVRDVAAVLPGLLHEPSALGRVFNIGSDREVSIMQLAETILRELDSASPIVTLPYEEVFGSNFEDLRRRRPNLQRVRSTVGFDAATPLETTIRDVAEWLSERVAGRPEAKR